MIHTCIRCPLRFSNRAELNDHMEHDHHVPSAVLESVSYPGAHEAKPLYRTFSADDGVHRVLLVANQTLGPAAVKAAADARQRTSGAEELSVFVLVPATASRHLTSASATDSAAIARDVHTDDAGLAHARWRLRQALALLRDAGLVCHGQVGDPDPLTAVAQVMGEETIDEIILSTLPTTLSRWLRADVPTALRRRFDVPLTVVTEEERDSDDPPATIDLRERVAPATARARDALGQMPDLR